MNRERKIFGFILVLAVLLTGILPAATFAEEKKITQVLKGTIDRVMEILRDEDLKQNPETRRELLKQTIDERFNYNQMAVRALAKNWNPRTSEERKEFTQRFRKLLERSYAQKIESFTGGEVRFTDEVVKGKYAMVKSKVEKNGKSINLDYKLIRENGEWKVYDFLVQGVSMIRNYRHQFARTLQKESFSELLSKMERTKEKSI